MTCCQIALGGNVGDVPATFAGALDRLAGPDLRIVSVSRFYETPPMGDAAGGTFLNAAATLDTTLDPLAVLERLLAAEEAAGRVRTVHWGPRAIDLDLIFYGDLAVDTSRLRVPHPACWYRRFVLEPLAEIAPDARHPESGRTVAELRQSLLVRPMKVSVAGSGEWAENVRAACRAFPMVETVRDGAADVAFSLYPEMERPDPLRRIIPVRSEAGAVRALLTAATGEPTPVS